MNGSPWRKQTSVFLLINTLSYCAYQLRQEGNTTNESIAKQLPENIPVTPANNAAISRSVSTLSLCRLQSKSTHILSLCYYLQRRLGYHTSPWPTAHLINRITATNNNPMAMQGNSMQRCVALRRACHSNESSCSVRGSTPHVATPLAIVHTTLQSLVHAALFLSSIHAGPPDHLTAHEAF